MKVKVDASGKAVIKVRDQSGSTGYRWQLKTPPRGVQLLKTERMASALPGGISVLAFYFHATRLPAKINFRLKRPWEAKPVKSLEVQLVR